MAKRIHFFPLLFFGCLLIGFAGNRDAVKYYESGVGKYRTGDHSGALKDWSRSIEADPRYIKPYQARGMLRFLKLDDYRGAVEDFTRVIELVDELGRRFDEILHTYRSRGMSYFLLGEYDRADKDLSMGIRIDPRSAHGHILRYIARERAGVDCDVPLREYLVAAQGEDWPLPVIKMLLGDIAPEQCLAAAAAADPIKTRGNRCEAYFYTAESYLLKGRKKEALDSFRKCLATEMVRYNEYRIAAAELKKMEKAGL